MVDCQRCLLADVIIKNYNQSPPFIGMGLRKCDYEMSVKIGDEGFYKKEGSEVGGDDSKRGLYRFTVCAPHTRDRLVGSDLSNYSDL